MDRLAAEYARIAFADIGDIADWDEGGALTLRAKGDIAKDDRAAIAELKTRPGKHGTRTTIRLHAKQAALDALAKHLGFFLRPGEKRPPTPEEQERERMDANAILRERLMRIVRSGEKN